MNKDQGGECLIIQGIKCHLPPVPPVHQIQNYDKPVKKQKWERTTLPVFRVSDIDVWDGTEYDIDEAISWEDAYRQEHIKIFGTDPTDVDRQGRERKIEGVTPDPEYYMECVESFRTQELDRIRNGHWVFINGKAYYLPGNYYLYLNYWQLTDGYAEFRYTDLELFYFWESVKRSKNFLGMVYVTMRGVGKSFIAGCIDYYEAIFKRKSATTVQSLSNDAAAEFFREKVLLPVTTLPKFLVPINKHKDADISNSSTLDFSPPSRSGMSMKMFNKMKRTALYSKMMYSNASEVGADGGTWTLLVQEEIGKCIGEDTPVITANGTIKMARDVVKSDGLMGPDSTRRSIFEITRGVDQGYRIIPNKNWDSWECVTGHRLALKWCNSSMPFYFNGKKYVKDDTVVMTIDSFTSLTKTSKKHLMLFKCGVEYPERELEIDPYLMGLWLGDGSKSRMHITNVDTEVIDHLVNNHNGKLVKYGDSATEIQIGGMGSGRRSDMTKKLKMYGVFKNKHIPAEYLINSRKNRLELLAGIIDSDGYTMINGRQVNCEIVQKNKVLAHDIKRLVSELGFGCSVRPKVATMIRKDGSIYSCDVYRIFIFGDMWGIPVKVNRKKFPLITDFNKVRRNTLHCGFKVEKIGTIPYVGFVINKDHMHLLGDCQVTHNTDPSVSDVYKRIGVNKFTVWRGNKKLGNVYASTTVEDMKAGGAECLKVWEESNQYDLNENNMTNTGLARFFRSALDATFFDEYGFPVSGEPDKETKKYLIAKYDMGGKGSREYHDAQRASLSHDQKALVAYKQKNPYTEEEAFWVNAEKCIYNSEILFAAKDRIMHSDHKLTRRGDIIWKEKDKEAMFVDNNSNGKWEISFFDFEPNMTQINSGRTKTFTPKAAHKRVMAVDPYSVMSLADENSGSMGAAAIYNRYDMHIDPSFSDTIIADYLFRPNDPFDFYEDILCAAFWFGCPVFFETNKSNVIDYCRTRGYKWGFDANPNDFIWERPSSTYTKYNDKPSDGMYNSSGTIEHYTNSTALHINVHGHKIKHLRVVNDWLTFNPLKTKKFDMGVAASMAIVAAERKGVDTLPNIDLAKILPRFAQK